MYYKTYRSQNYVLSILLFAPIELLSLVYTQSILLAKQPFSDNHSFEVNCQLWILSKSLENTNAISRLIAILPKPYPWSKAHRTKQSERDRKHRTINIIVDIFMALWENSRGFSTEGVKPFLGFAFEEIEKDRIQCGSLEFSALEPCSLNLQPVRIFQLIALPLLLVYHPMYETYTDNKGTKINASKRKELLENTSSFDPQPSLIKVSLIFDQITLFKIRVILYLHTTMKRQPYNNIRRSEKIRENQCFFEADGLQKKIRKFNANKAQGPIDAQVKMREIQCFWKEGWEYNHTHHIFLEPKVTRPQFYLKHGSNNERLESYYALLARFVSKLKAENEDETNFKIDCIQFEPEPSIGPTEAEMEVQLQGLIEFTRDSKDEDVARMSLAHFLKTIQHICERMGNSFHSSLQASLDNMMDEVLEEGQIQHLRLISQTCTHLLQGQEPMEEDQHETLEFTMLIMKCIQQAKQSKMYSSVIGTQPSMGKLTNIIHPLLLSLYSVFSKQLLVKAAKKKRGRQYADEQQRKLVLDGNILRERFSDAKLLKIQDNYGVQQQRHSKIVMINLDGYESQFNLQFVRNFPDNLMYVSFPKFENDQSYNYRFYKKIMFNFSRPQTNILGFDLNEDINLTSQREQIQFDPEKYYETIDDLYVPQQQNHGINSDFNKNVYVFPINLRKINPQCEISKEDRSVQGYESQLVRFIMRDHIYSAIKRFKPHQIILTYSGRIDIQNQHFLQMTQELIKACPKVLLFPNFTAALSDPLGSSLSLHKIGRGIINKQRHVFDRDEQGNPYQMDLMDKLSIFLKVTAGYYNLVQPFQQQDLYSKYKNTKVFRYIIYLYNGLKDQYEHCKRRIQSTTLEAARATLENAIKEHSKEIKRCIPDYYKRMFQTIGELLRGNILDANYRSTVQQIIDEYPPSFEEDETYMKLWEQIVKSEQLRLASEKYHEISAIQIRQRLPKEQYMLLKDEKMNNIDEVYRLSFFYKKQSHQIVKLYKDTAMLYQQNQYNPHKKYFNIVLTNLLTSDQKDIMHYMAKPKLSNAKVERCKIQPIEFHNRNGLIQRGNMFEVWTEWNYAQTNSHILLYWPSLFDFINFYLSKLLKRKYEPRVLHYVFAANKSSQPLSQKDSKFYQVYFGENVDVSPRWGCSVLNIDDQLYIFGGSFGSQNSYLNMQNDITTIDLTDNHLHDFHPAKMRNIGKDLYSGQAFWGKLREGKEVNSYVRSRIEFEFYQREQLVLDEKKEMKEEDYRVFYMIGGYGEEFKTPYSLFVNFVYEIVIERASRRLVSIKKINIPEKVIPINIKAMIKNKGSYHKANIFDIGQAKESDKPKCRQGWTNNNHYFNHRVVYAIKDQEIVFKIKNFFAVELYQNFKKNFEPLAKRMFYLRNKQEPQTVNIRKAERYKHQVCIDVQDIRYNYSLYLQLNGKEVQEIPLMNESIIAVDIKKLTIYALISHSKHTQNKCILAGQNVVLPQQSIIEKEKHYALVLKKLTTFEQDLHLHTLIIGNVNQVVLLHGMAFQHCNAKEYLIKTKHQNKNEIIESLPSVSTVQYSSITTLFAKKNNLITSINLLQYRQSPHCFTIARYILDINKFTEGWRQGGVVERMQFVCKGILLNKISVEGRIDSFCDVSSVVLLIRRGGKEYGCKLNQVTNESAVVQVQELTPNDIERYNYMQCLAKVMKNEELYQDFSYFQ